MTYQLAMSIGLDAGNVSMKKHARKTWNKDDWNAQVDAFNQAIKLIEK